MYICKVQGKCVSTIKNSKLSGYSMVILQKINGLGKLTGDLIVAVDLIGCGVGETVLITSGENARFALNDTNTPIDNVIVGIVDSCDIK